MILAFDSYYFNDKAKTVALLFNEWTDNTEYQIFKETIESSSKYKSGEFFKKELPCILSLMKRINLEQISTIIIDGFVSLDDNNKMGLGAYLYENINKSIPIIGVAKSDFHTLRDNKRLVYRGESLKPLYITSIGIELEEAAKNVKKMDGKYRIPTLLKKLDLETKTTGNTV